MTLSSVDLWLQELMGHPCFMPLGLKIIWHVLNQGAIKCLILDSCQQCLSPHKDWFFKCLLCLLSKGHNILFIRYFFGFLISIQKILFFACSNGCHGQLFPCPLGEVSKSLILDSCQQCLSPHKDWFFKCLQAQHSGWLCTQNSLVHNGHNQNNLLAKMSQEIT